MATFPCAGMWRGSEPASAVPQPPRRTREESASADEQAAPANGRKHTEPLAIDEEQAACRLAAEPAHRNLNKLKHYNTL